MLVGAGGASCSSASYIAASLAPLNGRCPVAIS
jgi:hypothetical protein